MIAPADQLTPISFLDRARAVFGDRLAVVDGDMRLGYVELADRCERVAGGLATLGVEPGDRVSVLAPNTHVPLECHFAVPLAGAVLNALNTRLAPAELAYIVGHAGSKVLICDDQLAEVGREVADKVDARLVTLDEYETLADTASPGRVDVADERALLSINYTSGTTGRPKGVMYSHRGAFLVALSVVGSSGLDPATRFLWTLPMFHCNGWCYPWAVTGVGGVHLCLRNVDPGQIWRMIRDQGVTHFNGAPTVLAALANHADAGAAPRRVRVATGGAPPSPTLLARMDELNVDITHLYGLTETYGPSVLCEWLPEWNELGHEAQAKLKARQGVTTLVNEPIRVVDDDEADVPADGVTQGEVVIGGSGVMLGYYLDPDATAAAITSAGELRTGDIGVMHEDGYVELRDRAKDVIISGGENITSIEVEQSLATHPAVLECAVVGAPDDHWGEVPVAFVTLRPGQDAAADELIDHVKARIARFKAPKRIEFGEMPRTATGKIQKFVLRERLLAESGS